jgi:histidyl-tRNA synthetase
LKRPAERVLRELDKLDKRGEDAVRATLAGEGFALSADAIDRLMAFSRVRSSAMTMHWPG